MSNVSDQQATEIIAGMVDKGLLEIDRVMKVVNITEYGKKVQSFLTHVREVDNV